jgi:hypothetical protein
MTAGANYSLVEDSLAASDPVRVEALLRLGNLYFRGLMVGPGKTTPEPDMQKAYIYFKMAAELDPKSQLAVAAKDQAEKTLTQEQKASAEQAVAGMKKNREELVKRASTPPTVSAPPAAPAAPPAAAPTTKKKSK